VAVAGEQHGTSCRVLAQRLRHEGVARELRARHPRPRVGRQRMAVARIDLALLR
jgi:hypothetical protein